MRVVVVMSVIGALAVTACAADPTTSDEYQQLLAEKTEVEANSARTEEDLAQAASDLEDSQAALSELEPELETAESELALAQSRVDELQVELDDWKLFTGSPNDEPFLWSQELFDVSVLTCTADGTSQEDCVCIIERIENEAFLMEIMELTEFTAAVELGLLTPNPTTGLPEGIQSDFVGLLTDIFVDCFG